MRKQKEYQLIYATILEPFVAKPLPSTSPTLSRRDDGAVAYGG